MKEIFTGKVINDGRLENKSIKGITVVCPQIWGYDSQSNLIESFPIYPENRLYPVPYIDDYVLIIKEKIVDYLNGRQFEKCIYCYRPYYRIIDGVKKFFNLDAFNNQRTIEGDDFDDVDNFYIGGENKNYLSLLDKKTTDDEVNNYLKVNINDKNTFTIDKDNGVDFRVNENNSLFQIKNDGSLSMRGNEMEMSFKNNKFEIKNQSKSFNELFYEFIDEIIKGKVITSFGPSPFYPATIIKLEELKNKFKEVLK